MKSLRLVALFALTLSPVLASDVFPGLEKIMTEAEWKRAGLDKLSPDQIGVIDAAVIRYVLRAGQNSSVAAQPLPPPVPSATAESTPAQSAAARSRFWDKFGLGKSDGPDWRTQPPMVAKVTAMRGANGFVLDNGQVWEGQEQIPFEILGQPVTIEARPLGAYALKLNSDSAAVRVHRVR